jgi:hypothetical protein
MRYTFVINGTHNIPERQRQKSKYEIEKLR